MELISLARREGEPVAVIYGATWEGGAVRAGLLFVQARLKRRDFIFRNPNTRQRYALRLPDTALRLKTPGRAANVLLEVLHDSQDTDD